MVLPNLSKMIAFPNNAGEWINLGVVGTGVVGVVGVEKTPAACAYDIFGDDAESDGVGEHEDPFIS